MKPSYHGLLVMDKPGGMTSRDVVDRALAWFPRGTRVGHTGTLDPLATGVLVLCVGAATRLTQYVQDMDKTYHTTIDLNQRSATHDTDAPVIEHLVFREPHPGRAEVERCLREFTGEIDQVPPDYSAAKVEGRRAYDLARRGEVVSLNPRRVRIYGIDLLSYQYPVLEMGVHCGKGTYIRSLARDLGQRLGRAGLVLALRRTRVGPFEESGALRLDIDASTARACLLPLSAAVTLLPRVTLEADAVARLRQGQSVPFPRSANLASPTGGPAEAAVLDVAGALVAVAAVDCAKRLLKPVKVLPENGTD